MAEGVGLEPTSPKAPVFKTGGLPIILSLREGIGWRHAILPQSGLRFHRKTLVADLSPARGLPSSEEFAHGFPCEVWPISLLRYDVTAHA